MSTFTVTIHPPRPFVAAVTAASTTSRSEHASIVTASSATRDRCSSPVDDVPPGLAVTATRLGRSPGTNQGRERTDDQPEVAPQRPVGDVDVVQPRHFIEGNIAGSEHLPHSRDPRLQAEAIARPLADMDVLFEDQRPRTDERHLAAEDVEQLRELVEREASQKAPERCDAWIFDDLEHPGVVRKVH